jgi:hypothetical protein
MQTILKRIAAEPTMIGTAVASVLPALVAVGVIGLDAEAIGMLVVAVNTLIGVAVRLLVEPVPPRRKRAAATA